MAAVETPLLTRAPTVAPPPGTAVERPPAPAAASRERPWWRSDAAILLGIGAMAAGLRLYEINARGLNSDEAVYAGQGASIAGDHTLGPYFPTFRAHPLLFQTLVSLGSHINSPEVFGRVAAAVLGVGTVLVSYSLAKLLYGRRAGLIAALIMALMPYHVVVTRQILLDGPMVFWSTVTLYLMARYAATERVAWLNAAAAAMGLTFLSKESSIILLGAIYAFITITPRLRLRLKEIATACGVFAVVISAFPLALAVAGRTSTGGNFLAWELFRRPNHSWTFYPTVVPLALGPLVVAAAALGLWLMRQRGSWRETLLLSWIVVPTAFFQLFPVKGFQYLLPIAPPVAVLAARFLADWHAADVARSAGLRRLAAHHWASGAVLGIVALSLAFTSWQRVQPSVAASFLAGSGGVPGGREAGKWIERNVPVGAQMVSIGPSMANILQFYGHRKVYGLSVSPNPLHRNPVYEPLKNADRLIRDNDLQYVVWDAYSADRTPFFAAKVLRYVERYHGRLAHAETVPVSGREGKPARKMVIGIYEVRP